MITRSFPDRRLGFASHETVAQPRAEDALVEAYDRFPGRWTLRTFVAATKVPGLFIGMSLFDAEAVLDAIERATRPANTNGGGGAL